MGRCPFLFLIAMLLLCKVGVSQTNNTSVNNKFQSSLIEPKSITKVGENHYFIDFGKDAFGTIVLTINYPQTDTLVIHLGEKIIHPNAIDRNLTGSIRYQRVQLTDVPVGQKYIVKLHPDKRNTNPPAIALPDSFGVIMPFRYCELENLTVPINDVTIRQKVYNYRFNDQASDFTCSDTLLNKVWDLCKYTIKATSFCGKYVDGDRERTPYEADALINQLGHYCVDNEYSMARNTNEYFINNPTWPTEWILHTVLLFYYDFLYTGDIGPISKNYEVLKSKTLIDLARGDGLISSRSDRLTEQLMKKLGFKNTKQKISDIVDWPLVERDGYEMKDINTVVNSFYYINLKLMAEIAGYLGKKNDSIAFYKKSVMVKDIINQKLFDKGRGIYIDGENSKHASLHANMFPLAFGIVPDKYLKSVVSFVKSRGMACSVYGAQYLLDGLYKQGEADYALSLMTATNDRSWWNMIKVGSTLALEAWDQKYKPNLDWNHAWGTAPANIVTRDMWGITPTQPGFKKVQIKPQLANLTFSKIKVPTIRGTIKAEYKIIDNTHKSFVIELPRYMTGEFVLLHDDNFQISVNKKAIKANRESIQINSGLTRIEIKRLHSTK